jgi:hypothetical protein
MLAAMIADRILAKTDAAVASQHARQAQIAQRWGTALDTYYMVIQGTAELDAGSPAQAAGYSGRACRPDHGVASEARASKVAWSSCWTIGLSRSVFWSLIATGFAPAL